jgi:hypothetical protein
MRTSGWNYPLLFHILAFLKKNHICTFEQHYSEYRLRVNTMTFGIEVEHLGAKGFDAELWA